MTTTFVEAFANGRLVEKFNDHFEKSSQQWDAEFFRTSMYKPYFSHVILGIAMSMILSDECRKFDFENLYHTSNDDMVRIIFTMNGKRAAVNTFFLGSMDMELLKSHNQQENKYLFNQDLIVFEKLAKGYDSIDTDLNFMEIINLRKLIGQKEYANFEDFAIQYKTYEISPQFSHGGIKMRHLESAQSSNKIKLNSHLPDYVHANLNSNPIKILTTNLLHVLHEDPSNVRYVRDLFKTIALLTMKDAHIVTKRFFEPIPHVSATETGQAGFFHGVLESMKLDLPFPIVYLKPAPHLKYDGNAWDSDTIREHTNSLLNYARNGEAIFTPRNTFHRSLEQPGIYTTDGRVEENHKLHPVLYLKAKDMRQMLERRIQPVIASFQHKTHPTVNEMCKQGIRNDAILVSTRSNYDQWITVAKTSLELHTIFSRLPTNEAYILKYLQNSFQVHLNLGSFRPDNTARYLALNILGFLQTPKADHVYKVVPKSNPQDTSMLNLLLTDSHKKIICIRFHDGQTPPSTIDHKFKRRAWIPRQQAVVVDVVNQDGSFTLRKSMVYQETLSKYFKIEPIMKTKLRKDLQKYAHGRNKYSEIVRDTLSATLSTYKQYFKSQADFHAFLDGYSLSPDTLIGLATSANEYTMAVRIESLKDKKWYDMRKDRQQELDHVTLHFIYDHDSSPTEVALGNLRKIRQSFKAEDSRFSSKTASFSIVLAKDEVAIACQDWKCNSENVKTFLCSRRRRRSVLACQRPEPQKYSTKNLHMEQLSKVTHGIQAGFMVKDIIADMINKDYKSLAVTSGLLAGSGVAGYLGNTLKNMGTGAAITAGSCLANIPFMAYNAWDAYHSFQNDDKFSGYTDLAMIGLDSLCLADGLLYALGVTAGIPVIGEVTFALSTLLLVSINLYSAYKVVHALNAQVQLSPMETFTEGIRAILHMKPEPLIDHLVKGKNAEEYIVRQSLSSSDLMKHFRYYITAAATDLEQNGKLIYEMNNFIDLRHTVHRSTKSRMMPNKIYGADYFCVMDVTKAESTIWYEITFYIKFYMFIKPNGFEDYYCQNSFGMKFNSGNRNLALYDLYDGEDVVYGFKNVSNFFRLGSGTKNVQGGDQDDTFFVNTDRVVRGIFAGLSGHNSIDLTRYNIDSRIYVSRDKFKAGSGEVLFTNISEFTGRNAAPETMNVSCEFQTVDSRGGSHDDVDEIYILNDTCNYDLKVHVHENTIINSSSVNGNVTFIVHSKDYQEISMAKAPNASYTFVYQSTSIWDVSFHMKFQNGTLELIINDTRIRTEHQEFTLYFSDAVLLWQLNYAVAYVYSNMPFEALFQKSLNLSQTTNISVTAHSQEINQSIVIATTGLQSADPSMTLVTNSVESHKSHIISLHSGNNVIRINTWSNAVVYLSENQNMTIDLHHLSHDTLTNHGQEILMNVKSGNFVQDCNAYVNIHTRDLISGRMIHSMSILISADDQVVCFNNLIIQNYASSSLKIINNQVQLVPDDIHLFNKTMIYISAFTVEFGSRMISDLDASDFSYYRFNRTLIVSNLQSDTTQSYVTMFFEEYSIHKHKFSSLIFEFSAHVIKLPDDEDNLLNQIQEWEYDSDFDLYENNDVDNDKVIDS